MVQNIIFKNAVLVLVFSAAIYFLVKFGFDWQYHLWTQTNIPMWVLLVADVLGFLLPIVLVKYLFLKYFFQKTESLRLAWKKVFQVCTTAVISGVVFSSFLKAIAGRESPPHRHGFTSEENILTWLDNSQNFQFGFLNEQIIGGFPSGHATVWFTLAFSFYFIFIKNKVNFTKFQDIKFFKYFDISKFGTLLFVLAICISLGVSFGFHWFTDVLAGATLGFVVATVLDRYFPKV